MYLSNFGIALLRRFECTGDQEDLDLAIASGDQAVDAATPGDPNRAGYLSNLCHELHRRWERAGEPEDLDRAIAVGRQAVELTSDSDEERAQCLTNLGNALRGRFERVADQVLLQRPKPSRRGGPRRGPRRGRPSRRDPPTPRHLQSLSKPLGAVQPHRSVTGVPGGGSR
jgi:hypothetical protein